MNTKNKIVTLLVVGVIGTGLLNGSVYAQEKTIEHGTFFNKLVEKISSTFGLDKAKVQKVVEEVHTEQKAEMQKNMQLKGEERLAKLVSEGKITEAQKAAIIAKHEEMKEKMKNMTQEERKAELEAWAKDQGIDPQYLMMGRGGHGFMRGAMGQPK